MVTENSQREHPQDLCVSVRCKTIQQNPESASLEMYIEQFLQGVNNKVFVVSKIQILTKTVLL